MVNQDRRQLQKERRQRARKRDKMILLSLAGLLTSLFLAFMGIEVISNGLPKWQLPNISFSFLGFGEDKTEKPSSKKKETLVVGLFSLGQQVGLTETASETAKGKSLEAYKGRLAQVIKVSKTKEDRIIYQLQFSETEKVSQVYEEDLLQVTTTFSLGQEVELLDRDGAGRVTQIHQGLDGYLYNIRMASGESFDNLTQYQLAYVYDIPLDQKNSAAENNQLIQAAMDYAQDYTFTVLRFPKGRFVIGSQTPDTEYLILRSNLELRGQETTLVVDGAARWYGLATGQTAYDGLSYFMMTNLHIQAKDLDQGNQFIIMANHGHSWQIKNNRFTLVHKMSSHIFDLGGVQNASFEDNIFEGYAPELTTVTETGDRDLHNFYAEAIQLDQSSIQTGWDGGFMRAIDPNYQWTSVNPIMSSGITIARNQFLPYYKDGKLIAYGATVGQHSSLVGTVAVFENVFTETLTKRFQASHPSEWVLEPIHFHPSVQVYIQDNTIN